MRWSELSYDENEFYIPYDENQRNIRGFLLASLGVNLENLPDSFFETFGLFDRTKRHSSYAEKVYLSDIIGTSYSDYGGKDLISAYMRLKRAQYYILFGVVTRGKYFKALKKPIQEQEYPVTLSKNRDGKYYIDNSGNHRVILYKIMMLAEMALRSSDTRNPFVSMDLYSDNFGAIRRKYWLNAKINL